MRALGYTVILTGEGQRVLTSAITEKFAMTSSGAFEPIVEASPKPVATTVTHAGVVTVLRYEAIPPTDPVQRTMG